MSEMRTATLEEIALKVPQAFAMGPFGSRIRAENYRQTGVPVIRGVNLGQAGDPPFNAANFVFVNEEKASELTSSIARPGDIVFVAQGTVGKVGIIPEKTGFPLFLLSQNLMKVTVDPEIVDPRFVYYFYRSDIGQHEIMSRVNTTGVPCISRPLSSLRQFAVRFPATLFEQRAVAEVLGALDDKIEANQRMRRRCLAMLRATFEYLVPEAGSSRERAPGDTPRLGDWLTVLETGGRPKGGVATYADGVPSVGAESIVELGSFNFGKTKFVPEEFFYQMRRGVVIDLDVLLYKDGGRPGLFEPHVSLFGNGFPFDRCCINEHVYRLRARPPLTQEYLYCWLTRGEVMEEMRRRGTGVAVPGLNSSAVRSLPIVVPTEAVLARFNRVAPDLVAHAHGASRESKILALLRDTLLPRLISGEMRRRDAKGPVEEAV